MEIEIDYDERKLTVKYDYLKDIEECHIYAIYDEDGIDLYDHYEERDDLYEMMRVVADQEKKNYME